MTQPAISVGLFFNFFSLINNGFTLLVSIILLSLLIKTLIRNNDTSLLLLTNCYIGLISCSLVLFINCIYILQGDYQISIETETLICQIRGYIIYVFMSAAINAFALQALFRFCCLMYPNKIWRQKRSIYIFLIIFLWFMSFILILPVYLWQDIQFIPNENVCLITTKNARGLIWLTVGIYGLPVLIIDTIYLKITLYLRRMPMLVSVNTKRDILIIRRIITISIVLFIIGLPTILSMIMLLFTKIGEPLFYRISTVTITISTNVLSVTLVYISPQLRNLINKSIRKNRVTHFTIQFENK